MQEIHSKLGFRYEFEANRLRKLHTRLSQAWDDQYLIITCHSVVDELEKEKKKYDMIVDEMKKKLDEMDREIGWRPMLEYITSHFLNDHCAEFDSFIILLRDLEVEAALRVASNI